MDYHSRLYNALDADRVTELVRRGLVACRNDRGKLTIALGDHAAVTCVEDADGRQFALRTALDPANATFREHAWATMEQGIPASIRSVFPADIQSISGGITIVGRRHVAALMEWIPGPTVYDAVGRLAERGNAAALEAIAGRLRFLSAALRDARVTHGDLTPSNLMLRANGQIVAVDLDTLEWPGARKRLHSPGIGPYRHPVRPGTPGHQDAFSMLVVYVSVLLLGDAPDLIHRRHAASDGEDKGLLFSTWDIANLRTSDLATSIMSSVGDRGQALLDLLIRACEGEAFRAQELLDQAFDLDHPGPTSPDIASNLPENPRPPTTDMRTPQDVAGSQDDIRRAVARLRELYGQDSPLGEVVQEERKPFGVTWPAGAPPQPPARSAPRRTEAPAPRPAAADDDGNAPDILRQLQVSSERVASAHQAILEASRSGDDREVLRIADLLLRQGDHVDEPSRKLVRRARERLEIQKRLNTALDQNDREELAELAITGDLALLGETDRSSLIRVLQALEWPTLQRAIQSDDDHLILLWFDEELFGDATALPDAMRRRISLAKDRIDWVESVRRALGNRDVDALERLVASEPYDARNRLGESERNRVRSLVDRQRALLGLDRALDGKKPAAIIAAMENVNASGATIDDPSVWTEVSEFVERAALQDAILAAARAHPPDDRTLAELVPRAKSRGVLHEPPLANEFSLVELEQMIQRGAAVRRIRRGIERNDDRAIRLAAWPDSIGALSLLTDAELERVKVARSRKRVKRIDI